MAFGFLSVLLLTVLMVAGGVFKPKVKEVSRPIAKVWPTPTPITIRPRQLKIPKLKIDAKVEEVGVTETGAMDVPKNVVNVGWFKLGIVPTTRGNAVISGHYDTPSGRPAIFYNIRKLNKGDTIELLMSDGEDYIFVVTGRDDQPIDVFPTKYVFRDKYGINLNLITCSGVWNSQEKNYSKRLVVYTTLKGTQYSAL